ncbi:right-handed parallel beta-helix repeat-containing protein [Corynebacterium durum]|uniref:right-handed parallel beta-helix repeat-containing protein n=1 Tax=Corynebacterium durum TaxID=61592 RepID=UPI00288ABEA9|nr:right-handed parallel beta-helix repeat-containing protein [Corynebacterium durum]
MATIKGTAGDVIKGAHYADTTWRSDRGGWALRYRLTDKETTMVVPQGLWTVTVVARNGQAFNVDVDVPEGDVALARLFVAQGGGQVDVAEVRREATTAAVEAANSTVSGVVESAKEAARQTATETARSVAEAAAVNVRTSAVEAAQATVNESVGGVRTAAVAEARAVATEAVNGVVHQATEAAKVAAVEAAREAVKALPAPVPTPTPGGVVTGVESLVYVRGADVTKELQAALDSPHVSEIVLVGESTITSTMWLDKASGKRIGSAVGAVLKAEPSQLNGPAMFCARAGVGVHHVAFRGLVADLQGTALSPSKNLLQLSDVSDSVIEECDLRNAPANLILLQGLGTQAKPGEAARNRVQGNKLSGAGLIPTLGVEAPATGGGVLVQNYAPDVVIRDNTISGVSGGMGVMLNHNAKDPTKAPIRALIDANHITMVESVTAFEPIGLTKKCYYAVIRGNVLPQSWDNGISVGGESLVEGNYIGSALNFGIAVSEPGTTVRGNKIYNVGLENKLRLEPAGKTRVDWAAVAVTNAARAVVEGNSYFQTDDRAECDYVVRFHREPGVPLEQLGGNRVRGNTYLPSQVRVGYMKNGNLNPAWKDVIEE